MSLQLDKTKGCMQHPYCTKCFTDIWNDDYTKYVRWLNSSHLFC